MADTIINYRNMTVVYFTWLAFLASDIVYPALAYILQFTTPFITDRPLILVRHLAEISIICVILSILFKYVFKQEILAWLFSNVIGLFGLVIMLEFGWNYWFVAFFGVSFLLLLCLGPYLHFD